MHSDAESTLNNLHVLAAISHNDKLMTNEEIFDIYSPTSLRGLLRMWYGEKRGQNIQRIRQTIRCAFSCATKSLDDTKALMTGGNMNASDQMLLRIDTMAMQHIRMCDGLRKAKVGLANLLQTYRDDAALVSQVTLLIGEIDDFVQVITPHTDKLRHRYPSAEVEFRSPLPLPPPLPLDSSDG
jgi:hypothetical protein